MPSEKSSSLDGKSSGLKRILEMAAPKSYDVPKIQYVAQGEKGKKKEMSLGKIFEAYGNYLKALEKFSRDNSSDYAVTMAINYLKIKKHKGYFKKCYSKYELGKENFEKVKKIAKEFSGSSGNDNRGTFSSFYQAIMRIKLPLNEIKKILDKDKNLIGNILSGEKIDDNVKKNLIHPQNEFFEYADMSKMSQKDLDKKLFENFGNLHKLSFDIPNGVNKFGGGELLDDLDLICKGDFKLGKTSKSRNLSDKEEAFLKIFVGQITRFDNKINTELSKNILKYNDICREGNAFNEEFKKEFPSLQYKKLTSYEKCRKFLQDKNGNTNGHIVKYFTEVEEYMEALHKAIYGNSKKEYKDELKSRFRKKLEEEFYEKFKKIDAVKNKNTGGKSVLKSIKVFSEKAIKSRSRKKLEEEFDKKLDKKFKEIDALKYENTCDKSVLESVKKSFKDFSEKAIKIIEEHEKSSK